MVKKVILDHFGHFLQIPRLFKKSPFHGRGQTPYGNESDNLAAFKDHVNGPRFEIILGIVFLSFAYVLYEKLKRNPKWNEYEITDESRKVTDEYRKKLAEKFDVLKIKGGRDGENSRDTVEHMRKTTLYIDKVRMERMKKDGFEKGK